MCLVVVEIVSYGTWFKGPSSCTLLKSFNCSLQFEFKSFKFNKILSILQVIIDSQPLTVAVLAALLFGESIGLVGAAGLVLGVMGLLLLEV